MDEKTTAVQIVEKVGGSYVLNTEELSGILKNVQNKKVAILTVAGAFRKGKSFFLSNCVRYLKCKTSGEDWMSPTAKIDGFTWRQSANAVTEGILMWPEPYIAINERGEEVAILLMDTEGAFDQNSSMTQCATVFALSALLSSVLVYNVIQDVQEDTLNHLQFFASYGKYALDNKEGSSPFQSLLFLIRDWQNGDEFGLDAGRRHLDHKLKFHASSNASMKTLRKDILRSFVDIKCALLPDPGRKICRGSEGAITVNDMDPEFRVQLGKLVPHLIDNLLRPKEIGGNHITGAEFLECFNAFVKIFASGKLPEPKSIYDATVDATHQSALKTSLDHYNMAMKTKFAELSEGQYFEDSDLTRTHEEFLSDSVKMFTDAKKMGSVPKYLESLKLEIEASFKLFHQDNNTRMMIEKALKEKEEVERKRIEEAKLAEEELARQEKEKEELRILMEHEKQEKAEIERRRLEDEIRHKADIEVKNREILDEQNRAREEMERMDAEAKLRAEEENERHQALVNQMEIIQDESQRQNKEHQEQLERERQQTQLAIQQARKGNGGGGLFGNIIKLAETVLPFMLAKK